MEVWAKGKECERTRDRRTDKAIPEAWNWKAEGKAKVSCRRPRLWLMVVGGMALGSLGLSRGGDRF